MGTDKRRKIVVMVLLSTFCLGLISSLLPHPNAALAASNFITEITSLPFRPKVVDVDSAGRIFVGDKDDRVWRSTDHGITWTKVFDASLPTNPVGVVFVNSLDYVFASIYAGPLRYDLYRSIDNGQTWSPVNPNSFFAWNMDEMSNRTLFYNTYHADAPSYIYKSDDDGATWCVFCNLTGIVDHFHWVFVADNDDLYASTGDGQYDATIQRWNPSASSWDVLANDTNVGLQYQTTAMMSDENCVYFLPDGQNKVYCMEHDGENCSDFHQIMDLQTYRTGISNFVYDAVRIGNVYLFSTDEGQVWGSWDGEHWVKIMDCGRSSFVYRFTRKAPIYFVDINMGKLCRLDITKEDMIQLYYSVYISKRGYLANAENYVLEQRIWNGTNYLDLTRVALSNVNASIEGLSRNNQILLENHVRNAGFEWANKTGWQVYSGSGTYGVASVSDEDNANGTYSLKVTKSISDTLHGMFREPNDAYTTINRGDILVVSAYIRGNISIADRVRINFVDDTSGTNLKIAPSATTGYALTTSWTRISAYFWSTEDSVNVRLSFTSLKGASYTIYWDSILLQKLEVGIEYNNGQNNDAISYVEQYSPSAFFTSAQTTRNPSLAIAGQSVSYSGSLANGTETPPQSLSGVLTGAVKVDANIQGSGQAILRINGTRTFTTTNVIIKGFKDEWFHGRYYGTPTLPTELSALTNLQANIISLAATTNKLTLTINSPLGTNSTTIAYVKDKGEPKAIYIRNGTLTWNYNASDSILLLKITHNGLAQIVVDWRMPGDVNGNGSVDTEDLALVSEAYGATPESPNWNDDADLNADNKVDVIDLETVGRNYG